MLGIEDASQLLGKSIRGITFVGTETDDELLRRKLIRVCSIFYHGLRSMAGAMDPPSHKNIIRLM